MKTINQVLILAGGKGTRMREMTSDLPKPMVKIGERPVLDHLINIFNHFGSFEFVVCTGYLSEIIEEYFKDYDLNKYCKKGVLVIDVWNCMETYKFMFKIWDNQLQ